jgi:drug/metabolite transporter (DMT)-like permease
VIGDVLALVSAACYGLYTVLLRSRLAAATSRARGTARESDNDDVVEDGEEDSSEVDAGTTSLFLGKVR